MLTYAQETDLKELMAEGFCVVDFYSDTCGPCKMLAPVLAKLESELPFIHVIKVNISTYPAYAQEFDIHAVPTILFINDGELKERALGFMTEAQLREKISEYMYG